MAISRQEKAKVQIADLNGYLDNLELQIAEKEIDIQQLSVQVAVIEYLEGDFQKWMSQIGNLLGKDYEQIFDLDIDGTVGKYRSGICDVAKTPLLKRYISHQQIADEFVKLKKRWESILLNI